LSAASASERYGDEYYAETHRNWFEYPNLRLFETIHGEIFAAKQDAAILDIGCGKGDLLRFLRGRNHRYLLNGIDLSQKPAIAGVDTFCGDVRTHRFDRSYDAVVSLAAIEHVDDVRGFVSELKDLCKPGGQVIIMTLNDRSVLYAAARWLATLGWQQPVTRLYDKHHLNHFNVRSLHQLLTREGLDVKRTLMHNAPLKAMDFPASSPVVNIVQRVGVWGAFSLGHLARATYLQTVVCRRMS
jgi:2-polyprenyl-3-methyl-5-hydroxy-6-metoxy-1,4-benzoquinol methylase